MSIIIGNPILIGGGSGGLNVMTAAELPDAIPENRIICITETTPATIIADTVAPTDPTAGDIWIKMGSGSGQVTLGSDTNQVNVRPAMVWQYGETGWNPLDAYLGAGGEWVKISSAILEMGVRHVIHDSSPLLKRLGAAVGLSAVTGIGAVPQESDFDTMPIYREIRRCNLAADGTVMAWEGEEGFSTTTADVMVYIPKFWYRRVHDGINDEWWIANGPAEGYAVHPAFARSVPYDDLTGIFISAYEVSAGHVSVSGQAAMVRINRPGARAEAAAKGVGWSQMDLASTLAVNLLVYIEYASLDGQTAIAPGNCDNIEEISLDDQEVIAPGNSDNIEYVSLDEEAHKTGTTDGMAGHTGSPAGTPMQVCMKWRGIENWWGNVLTWVDGLNVNERAYYFCLDPDHFADDTDAYYTAAGFSVESGGYVKEVGYNADHPWLILPTTRGGSENTYFCDSVYGADGWRTALFGGDYKTVNTCGPACWYLNSDSSFSDTYVGYRLLYLKRS